MPSSLSRFLMIIIDIVGRPELITVLTKLHIFRLIQYKKLIYLDADVLPLRPLSNLFSLAVEFAAVPDVGWPDTFNSGMMLLVPAEESFQAILNLVYAKGSWDGGDQGILNEWRGHDWYRLSFVYNVTRTSAYGWVVVFISSNI